MVDDLYLIMFNNTIGGGFRVMSGDLSNQQNIITKSQVYTQMSPCNVIEGIFAKTVNYNGVHCNFCLDIPEIIEEEQRLQEKRDDIAKFTALSLSDGEYQDELIENLLKIDNLDILFDNEVYADLACNDELLHDLGIS